MNEITIRNVKFGSFMKISVLVSLSFGAVFGLIVFIVGVFGGPVSANIGATRLTGFAGGAASLIIAPFMFLVFGAISGLLTFFPFKLALKVLKSVSIFGEFEGTEACSSTVLDGDINSEQSEEK